MSTGIPSNQAAALSQTATMSSTSSAASAADLGIESQDIKTAPGVDLDKRKTVLVGSVLDVGSPLSLFRFSCVTNRENHRS
jgi:hypothetical protein